MSFHYDRSDTVTWKGHKIVAMPARKMTRAASVECNRFLIVCRLQKLILVLSHDIKTAVVEPTWTRPAHTESCCSQNDEHLLRQRSEPRPRQRERPHQAQST